MNGTLSITTILIGITVVISWLAFGKQDIVRRFVMNPYLIHHRQQYYRFVTSGFLHGDFSHLLWNMFSFYFFGSVVEMYFAALFGEL